MTTFALRLETLSDAREPSSPMSPRERTRYASVLLQACGLEAGDVLVLEGEIDEVELLRQLSEDAYHQGARAVRLFTRPQSVLKLNMVLAGSGVEVFSALRKTAWRQALDDDAAFLRINDGMHGKSRECVYEAEWGNLVRWTLAYWPTEETAYLAYGDDPDAMRKLALDLLNFGRCAERDPLNAWERHIASLRRRAAWLNALELEKVIVLNGETETHAGFSLLEGSEWRACEWETARGRRFVCNVPTEEVFTTPDPRKTTGWWETTRPTIIASNLVLTHARGEFTHGVLRETGFECAPWWSKTTFELLAEDSGTLRVGELALVGEDSRIARKQRTYQLLHIDENAGVHFALGESYLAGLQGFAEDPERNRHFDGDHHDLTIGDRSTHVFGLTRDGRTVELIRDGRWRQPERYRELPVLPSTSKSEQTPMRTTRGHLPIAPMVRSR